MEKFNGLILFLYKRQLYLERSDIGNYSAILFGHYDGMQIRLVDNWQGFSPYAIHNTEGERGQYGSEHGDRQNAGVRSFEEPDSVDRYTVKVVFPQSSFCEKYRNCFDYTLWMEQKLINSLDFNRPLFGALLITTTSGFVRGTLSSDNKDNKDDEMNRIAKLIQSSEKRFHNSDNSRDDAPKRDYSLALFRSIGYHDYVILYKGQDWARLYSLADEIRMYKDNSADANNGAVRVVSNVYIVQGMSAVNDSSVADELVRCCCGISGENYHISLKLKYKCPMSLREFRSLFDGEIRRSRLRQYADNLEICQEGGQAACTVKFSEIPLYAFLREYLKDGMLTPDESGEGFFSQYIADITTSFEYIAEEYGIEYGIAESQSEDASDCKWKKDVSLPQSIQTPSSEHEATLKYMRQTLTIYRQFANRYDRHTRIITALGQMTSVYENLTHAVHTFPIRSLIDPILITLSDNIRTALYARARDNESLRLHLLQTVESPIEIVGIRNLEGWEVIDEEFKIPSRSLDNMEKSLNRFRENVGRYIQLLSASDSLFMERSQTNQSAIGSAAKLIFSLNNILNRLVKDTEIDNDSYEEQLCRVLLISGGRDWTTAINYSQYTPMIWQKNDGEDAQYRIVEKRIITIQIPERSIYDMGGTIMRCCHEIWHYCGKRNRVRRADATLLSLARLEANLMAYSLVDKDRLERTVLSDAEIKRLKELEGTRKGVEGGEEQFSLDQLFQTTLSNLIDSWQNAIYSTSKETLDRDINQLAFGDGAEIWYYGEFFCEDTKRVVADLNLAAAEYASSILYQFEDTAYGIKLFEAISTAYHSAIVGYYSQIRSQAIRGNDFILTKRVEDVLLHHMNAIRQPVKHLDKAFTQLLVDFLQGFCLASPSMSISEGYASGLRDEMRETFMNLNINFIDEIRSVCEEAYSDYMMCETLQPTFGEYVSSFLYERWELDYAMPCTPLHAMRLGIIIDIYFMKDGETGLEGMIDNLTITNNDGAGPLRNKNVYLSNLKDQIKKIWDLYKTYDEWQILDSIKEYLIGCRQPLFEGEGYGSVKDARRIMDATREKIDVNEYLDLMLGQWAQLAVYEMGV